jgi:hypothetical protein
MVGIGYRSRGAGLYSRYTGTQLGCHPWLRILQLQRWLQKRKEASEMNCMVDVN